MKQLLKILKPNYQIQTGATSQILNARIKVTIFFHGLFLSQFSNLYDKHFPIKILNIKTKNILSPWITKGITKSSKQKQKLYIKFLKNKSTTNNNKYKTYKQMFEKIKKVSKKQHYSKLILNINQILKKPGAS